MNQAFLFLFSILLLMTSCDSDPDVEPLPQGVMDVLAPDLESCPSSVAVALDGNGFYIAGDYTTLVTATDNITPPDELLFSQLPVAGTELDILADDSIFVYVVDAAMNEVVCGFAIEYMMGPDTQAPSISCPLDQEAPADINGEFVIPGYTDLAIYSDDVTPVGDITVTQSPVAGTIGIGSQSICLTATDEAGNSAQCCFTVTGVSDAAPIITSCPVDTYVSVDANCGVFLEDYTSVVSFWDEDMDNLVITQTPYAGTSIIGTYTVCVTATDPAGNSSSCCWLITAIDDTPPTVLNCPSDMNVTADGSGDYDIPDFTSGLTVQDNCSIAGEISVTQTPVAGTLISGIGTTQMITITATDANGNQSPCQFEITLE